MVDLIGKTILVESIRESLKKIYETVNFKRITQEERERMSDALISIQKATVKTRNFIRSKGYESNEELSELWSIALKKSIDANIDDLPNYLFHKSRFWGRPQDWLMEKSSMELVPKLNYLEEQCEVIIIKLTRNGR